MSTVMARTARKARTAETPHPRATRTTRSDSTTTAHAPVLLLLVAALCLMGVVMVGSASPMISILNGGSSFSILEKEVLWMLIGGVVLYFSARFPYEAWRRLALPALLVVVGCLFAVYVPGIGSSAGGATRWLGAGQLRFQPSELAKFALVLVFADVLTRRADKVDQPRMQMGPVIILLGVVALPVFFQPDLGTTMVLVAIAFGVMFAGGVRVLSMAKFAALLAVVAVCYVMHSTYQRQRMTSFLHPASCAKNSCYQVWQSLLGLGSGHVFGLGLSGGHAAWGVLPNAQTDFIFSVVGEELGFVGAAILIALFFTFAWFGYRVALRAPDRFGSLVAAGITTWVIAQASLNIGAVIGAMPVTGIPLPFVSFGGTSLVITLGAVGALVNIAKQGDALAASTTVAPLGSRRRSVARA